MRQVVFDTETTGVSISGGDRVIEIGCVELIDMVPTGKVFQTYVNPCRDVSESAFRVHGLSTSFLRQFSTFDQICDDFLKFIKHDELIAHNAQFDVNFINNELKLCDRSLLINPVVDTLDIARKQFPGSPVSLDALCSRFNINASMRTKHGALLDAELLSLVYIELNGGRQQNMFEKESSLDKMTTVERNEEDTKNDISDIVCTKFIRAELSELEDIEHKNFIDENLTKSAWCK